MDIFKEKYKNIFRDLYDEDNENDDIKEPFQSKSNEELEEMGLLEGDEAQPYVTIMVYVSILLVCCYFMYTTENRLVTGSLLGGLFILIPLLIMLIMFFVKSKAGEMPMAKVFFGVGLLVSISIAVIGIPSMFAVNSVLEIAKGLNIRDISILFFSIGTSLSLLNSIFGFLGMNQETGDSFSIIMGIITFVLIASKSLAPSDSPGSSSKNWIFFIIGILILLTLLNSHATPFISDNDLGLKGVSASLILILLGYLGLDVFIMEGKGFPDVINGLFSGFFVMMIPIINNLLNVIDIDSNISYTIFGIIATLIGISIAGNVFDLKSAPGKGDFIDHLRKDRLFSFGIFARILLTIIIMISGYRYLYVVNEDISSYEEFEEARKAITFIFPILLIMGFGTNIFRAGSSMMSIFYTAATLFAIALWFYILSKMTDTQKEFINYIVGFLIIIFIILSLAMTFLLFGNYLTSMDGMMGIVSNLIFYIPCLLIDFINWIKNEFNNTTPTLGILLILEILVILSYFYVPSLINKVIMSSGIEIVKQPNSLDSEIELVGGDRFKMENEVSTDGTYSKKSVARINYSMSMWVNINNNAHNQNALINEQNIFNYDNKPGVEFKINTDPSIDGESHFIFTLSNEKGNLEETIKIKVTLPLQKWHYFVFNYNYNTVDIFINGSLYNSYKFDNNNKPTYDIVTDNIFIGDDDGLKGSICNVIYNTTPLKESEIVNTYNLLNNLNPPINNL